jgi:hypothetical protein
VRLPERRRTTDHSKVIDMHEEWRERDDAPADT